MPIVTSLKDRIEELERVVAQQRRFAVRVKTQNAVSKALASSETADEALTRVLEIISAGLNWQLALFWSLDTSADVMRCAHAWQAAAEFDQFIETSRSYVFSRGMGVPGEVWARKTPVSMSNVQEAENFPRLPLARAVGLHGVFAFPVTVGDTVSGVVEAYTREHTGIDDESLVAMSAIGSQVGDFLARKQSTRTIELSDAGYRTVIETAPDAVFVFDSTGRILVANSAASTLFGHSAQELTGLNVSMLLPELATRAAGKQSHSETATGRHKDGRQLRVEISCSSFSMEAQTLFTCFIRDASERSRSQSA